MNLFTLLHIWNYNSEIMLETYILFNINCFLKSIDYTQKANDLYVDSEI